VTSEQGPPSARMARTRLQAFLDANGFTSAQLEATTSIARQTMTRIRAGRDLRLSTMLRILQGVRRIANWRVQIHEIFDVDPDPEQ
jgi:predicted transcriptional regulator